MEHQTSLCFFRNYLYNFANSNEPQAINLPAGLGREFTNDMNQFIETIKNEIKSAFTNQDFEKRHMKSIKKNC